MNFLPGDFSFAPAPPGAAPPLSPPKPRAKRPWAAFWLLGLILLGCALAGALAPRDPGYLDLSHIGAPPSSEFWFGTDPMGRDLFSMIWARGTGVPLRGVPRGRDINRDRPALRQRQRSRAR